MKAVVIGTDLIHHTDGSLKVLEINTNIELYTSKTTAVEDYLDLTELRQVLIDNQITEFHYIYVPLTFSANDNNLFKNMCDDLGISWFSYETPKDGITIPYIEDAPNKFIMRFSYDTTALVDDTYCRDNFEFLKLVEGQEYSYKRFIGDESYSMDTLTSLDTSTNYPNVILKSRLPNYNSRNYPKLFKLNSQEEVDNLKGQINYSEHYLEEYIISDDNLIDNKTNIIRSIDIIYGGDLSTLHLGSHYVTSRMELDTTDDVYDENNVINQIGRVRYSTKNSIQTIEKTIMYHVDGDSTIALPDGTFTNISGLDAGSVIAAPSFAAVLLEDQEQQPYQSITSTFQELVDTFNLETTTVDTIKNDTISSIFVNVVLEDGTNWTDLPTTIGYVELKDSNVTRFLQIQELEIGDKFILYNHITNEFSKKTIQSLDAVYLENQTIYQIDVENIDVFFSAVDDTTNQSIIRSMIMHNLNCWCYGTWCGSYSCHVACSYCKSDIYYKENIKLIGKSKSNINIYQFNYKGEEGLYQGVIAQELIGTIFEDSLMLDDNGKYLVDYNKIDVKFKKLK